MFGFDVLVCDRCGGPRRILGAVTEPAAVRRVLVALGLAAQPPPAPVFPAACRAGVGDLRIGEGRLEVSLGFQPTDLGVEVHEFTLR